MILKMPRLIGLSSNLAQKKIQERYPELINTFLNLYADLKKWNPNGLIEKKLIRVSVKKEMVDLVKMLKM